MPRVLVAPSPPGIGGVGAGVADKVAVWTDANTIGVGQIIDTGSLITIPGVTVGGSGAAGTRTLRATSGTPGTLILNDLGGSIQIGPTPAVAALLTMRSNDNSFTALRIENSDDNTAARSGISMQAGSSGNVATISVTSALFTDTALSSDALLTFVPSDLSGGVILHINGNSPYIVRTNNIERHRTLGSGEVLIGRETSSLANTPLEVSKSVTGGIQVLFSNPDGAGVTSILATADTANARFGGIKILGPTNAGAFGLNANEVVFGGQAIALGATVITTISAQPIRIVVNQVEASRWLPTGEPLVGGTTLIFSEMAGFQKNFNGTTRVLVSNTDAGVNNATEYALRNDNVVTARVVLEGSNDASIPSQMTITNNGNGISIEAQANNQSVRLRVGSTPATVIEALDASGTLKLGIFGATPVIQQTIVALTDNVGGEAADDTVDAIADPADAPASVDALRDDLVANTIPDLRNALKELLVKVNELRSKVGVNYGLLAA